MKKKIAIILSTCIISGAIVPTIGTAYALENLETNNYDTQSGSEVSSEVSENTENSKENSSAVTDDNISSSNASEENVSDTAESSGETEPLTDVYVQNNGAESLHEEVNILEDGYYTIGNGNQVIDIYDTGYTDGVQAITYQASSQNNQLFSFEKQADGNYKITAVHSKKALTMQADGSVVQSRWEDANNQKWKVIRDVRGNYYIQNVESSKSISFANGSIQGTVYNQNASQQLQLEKRNEVFANVSVAVVEDGTYQIQSSLTGKNLGVENNSTLDGANIELQTSSEVNSQKWIVKNRSDGQTFIESAQTPKLLDLDIPSQECHQWVDGGNLNQRWYLGTLGDGYYIKNAATGTVLDVSGDTLKVSALTNVNSQKWKFTETEVHEEVNILENGYYTIGNGNQVVDIYDTGYTDGVQAITYQASSQNNQLFSFEKQADGNYKITAVHSKKALTMQADGSVVQSRWEDANNQKWKVIRDVRGNYYIQNVESSKSISFANGSIQGTVYNQNASQQLQLEKRNEVFANVSVAVVEDGTYQIQSSLTGKNLGVENNSWFNGASILQMTSADVNNQKWHLENSKDGKVRLVSVSSRKVLDLDVASGKYVQWKDAVNTNQRWYIEQIEDNYYIRNHSNNSAMGIRDNAMEDGDYVVSMAFNANADNQKWEFIETEISDTPIAPNFEILSSLGDSFEMCQTTVLTVGNTYTGNLTYEFSMDYNGRHIILQNDSTAGTYRWTPIEPGTYTINVTVKIDSQVYDTISKTIQVVSNGKNVLTGIDVSEHQENINWNTVKASGIQYAMIRSGYGREISQIDDYFEQNYAGAVANDIPVGIYYYSYADSPEDAVREARVCLQILNGRPVTLPVAYDIEDESQNGMTREMLTDVAIAFCDEIKAAGYYPMIYCNPNFIKNRLDMVRLREKGYDVWIASYGVSDYQFPYPVKMWQYTSEGSVPGINGNVDMNNWYVGEEYYGGASLPDGPKGRCTGDNVNIRSAPTFGDNVLYPAFTGYTFTVLEKQGVWYHVAFGGNRYGWIHQDYVELI